MGTWLFTIILVTMFSLFPTSRQNVSCCHVLGWDFYGGRTVYIERGYQSESEVWEWCEGNVISFSPETLSLCGLCSVLQSPSPVNLTQYHSFRKLMKRNLSPHHGNDDQPKAQGGKRP